MNCREYDYRVVATTEDTDLAGEGTDQDQLEMKAKVRSARSERTGICENLARLKKVLKKSMTTITADDVREILDEFATLLIDGAAGKLGEEAIFRALKVFKDLTGGCIMVEIVPRPARTQTNALGRFRCHLVQTVCDRVDFNMEHDDDASQDVKVWLREPPRCDLLAPHVHELIDEKQLTFAEASRVLKSEGKNINPAVVRQIYDRYYEMLGEPKPVRTYNNGQRRKSN